MSYGSNENGIDAEEVDDMDLYHLADETASATTYESDTDKKLKKKKANKPPRSPKSPYLTSTNLSSKKAPVWRSLKGTGMMHTENPLSKVPRQLWLASLKQGNGLTQNLKVNSDIGQAWATPSSSTPEYLKEALGMKKPKYSRSSTKGYIPGTPDYKEKEDMYDHILDLKKMLQAQKSESDIMKTKLRRLEEENNRKDRQIEQLLEPSMSSDFARNLLDKKSENSLVLNNLRQKILKLEKQCKEKDQELGKLQADLKTTSIEEMRLAMETYYEEIQRLQMLLARSEASEKRPPSPSKESQKQQKVLKSAVMRLSKQMKELQDENQSLKADLERVMSRSPTSSRTKGHTDRTKQRQARRISDPEKKLEKQEKPSSSSGEQENIAKVTVVTNSIQGDTSHSNSDLHNECERLRTLLKKVKEDRSALQTLLATKESELKKLQQEMNDLDKQLQRAKERNEEREEIGRLNQKIKNLEAKLGDEKLEKETILEDIKKKNSSQGSNPNSDRNIATRPRTASSVKEKEQQVRQEAAQLIQKNWRLYKNMKDNCDIEEETLLLQSVLRGHLARQKMLSTSVEMPATSNSEHIFKDPDSDPDNAVSLIQSTLRAHTARVNMLDNSTLTDSVSSAKKSSRESMRSPTSRKSFSKDDRISLADESSRENSKEWKSIEERKADSKKEASPTRTPQRTPSALQKKKQHAEEVQSDDSDDIIIVPPSRPRRRDSYF
ncbi:hypothetical protein GDO86_017310 [Hymenochirus boettgeri]|uniref:IQ domain-containing protein E n=1 Tax=Hymenochirus boettgeri TaxID=247094 RepID=A0A8T2IPI6_9PIPI|nr:hypothetical protein GDO86_017310 [Hymenochirus boettgeri]